MDATTTVQEILKVAASQVGVREGRDANGNWNNRVKYTTWYADRVKNNAFLTSAWCAIFISWLAFQAGGLGTIIPLHAWTPSGLAWFTKRRQRVSNPRSGDIVYFYYPSKGRVAHVGIVESVSGGYITTIEGNTNTSGSSQGNGVYRLRRPINSNMRFCRPAYSMSAAPVPAAPAPVPAAPAPVPARPKAREVGTVSVSNLKAARYNDPNKAGTPLGQYANEVYTMELALARTDWIKPELVDGHFGTGTVGDGSAGFGGTTGFQKKHSGARNPDGWLGLSELRLLFKLAGMSKTVTS